MLFEVCGDNLLQFCLVWRSAEINIWYVIQNQVFEVHFIGLPAILLNSIQYKIPSITMPLSFYRECSTGLSTFSFHGGNNCENVVTALLCRPNPDPHFLFLVESDIIMACHIVYGRPYCNDACRHTTTHHLTHFPSADFHEIFARTRGSVRC